MTYLSLFSGVGGGDLGMQHLLGWECLGYVEWDEYCCRVLEQRIREGFLSPAPVWQMDIREFNERVAERYRGVDCITGGFPCQPFSVAGKGLAADDPRNQWPATRDCIRTVEPGNVFLENVPGLLAHEYFGTILADLAESGFDVRWRVLSAAELGAPHRRDRLWIVGDSAGFRRDRADAISRGESQTKAGGGCANLREQVMLPTPRAIYGEHPGMTDPKI